MRRVSPDDTQPAVVNGRRMSSVPPVNMAGRSAGRHRHIPRPGVIQERLTHSLRRRRSAGPDYSAVNPFVKYVLIILNFLCMLAGLALVAATSYVLHQKDKTVNSFVEFAFDLSCILCLIGCIGLVISFFGFGGALRESILFQRIYYISLSLLFLLEIVVIIFVFVFYFVDGAFADLGWYPEDTFREGIKKYRTDEDADVEDFIDGIQEFFHCCGVSNNEQGYLDWNANLYFNCTTANPSPLACSVPFSCCRVQEGDNVNYKCGANALRESTTDRSAIYTDGCLKGVQDAITDNIWVVGGVVLAVFIPQAFVIILAKALVSQIQEQMSKW